MQSPTAADRDEGRYNYLPKELGLENGNIQAKRDNTQNKLSATDTSRSSGKMLCLLLASVRVSIWVVGLNVIGGIKRYRLIVTATGCSAITSTCGRQGVNEAYYIYTKQ